MYALIAAAALALTGPQVGQPAPDFHLTTVDGKPVSLADFRGKTVVLNDWATWCPPCRDETPDLIASAKRLVKRGDVVFLGIDSTEAAPIVRAFVASKGVPYRQAIDASKTFANAYDVQAFPTTYVIDPSGVLRARYVGNVSQPILSAFVGDARAGRDSVLATEAQKKVDALLDPAAYAFTGDPATIRGAVQTVLKKIDEAEAVDGDTDYLRTQREENALREAAVNALSPVAETDADRVLVARLQGDTAVAREQLDVATSAYSRGLALSPNDPDLLGGYADALRRRHDYPKAIEVYT
ncbi:MAG: redoxin family protein, partial [Candidatus Elarobacter sp.]